MISSLLQSVVFASYGTSVDMPTMILLSGVLGLLLTAWGIGWALKRQPESTANPAVVRTFNLRVRAWLLMFAILIAAFVMGFEATVTLFGLISFWALREFITMTPTRRGDHRTLFWTFFIFTPLQYVLVGLGTTFYGLYTVMIPVYASLVIPARIALSGDPKRFLERAAKIQSALLICVYALSHAPAILTLDLTTSDGKPWSKQVSKPSPLTAQRTMDNETVGSDAPLTTENPTPAEPPPPMETKDEKTAAPQGALMIPYRTPAGVLFYFLMMVQLNDVLQFGWGKLVGRHVIAPAINASRTWEGFIGGTLSTMLIGSILCFVTPFQPWEAACMAGAVAVMGFAGSMVMSAIKRDRGVTDYGTLIQGHAGVLDRLDSICFAAPIFFHLTRYFFSTLK